MGLFIRNYNIANLAKSNESEKAIAVKGWANYEGSKKVFEIAMWVPKSIIKNGEIPAWFLQKKHNEYCDRDLDVIIELA